MNVNKALITFIRVAFGVLLILLAVYAGTKLCAVGYDFGYRVFTEPAVDKAPGKDVWQNDGHLCGMGHHVCGCCRACTAACAGDPWANRNAVRRMAADAAQILRIACPDRCNRLFRQMDE